MVAIFHGFFVLYYLLDSFLRRFSWEKTLHSWLSFRQQPPLAQSTVIAGRSSRLLPLTELRRVFELFDRNKDGRITACELSDSLEDLGIFISHKDLVSMLKKIDGDGEGCMDLDEFGVLWQRITKEEEGEDDMREAFNVFDETGDGFITVEELQSVLLSLGLQQGRVVEDCREMVRKVDVDGDGMVNYSEFKEMMVGGGGILAAS